MYKKLLDIIVCPICRKKLIFIGKKFICKKDKLYFPIKKGIPVLMIEKAKKIKKK